MDKGKLVKISIILITLIIAYFLLSQISITQIVNSLMSVSAPVLIVSFALYSLMNGFRALRYSLMVGKPGGKAMMKMFGIVCTHNMANNVLPFRTGELTFVYLARVRLNVAASVGAVTVLMSRIYDIFVICLLVIAIAIAFPGNYGMINGTTSYLAISALVMFLAIALFVVYPKLLIALLDLGYRTIPSRYLLYLRCKMAEIAEFYATVNFLRSIPLTLILSIIVWLLSMMTIYVLAVSMGFTISPWAILIGILIVVIASSIPVQGIANLGSFELIWSFVFIALNVSKETAISSGFAIHLIILTFAALLWLATSVFGRAGILTDPAH